MKQNVKVNTPIHIRPASPEEAGLFRNSMRPPTRGWARSAMSG